MLEFVAGSYNERGGDLQLDLPSIKKAGAAKNLEFARLHLGCQLPALAADGADC